MKRSIPFISSFYLLLMLLISCSQEKNTFVSKTYHNLTARDNAYFLGRERLKDVEKELDKMKKDDYNKVINVMIPLDTNQTKQLFTKLDDILKKASLPIHKHKNSNWVDDSFILVGKARIYKNEYPLAIETFKYVNSKSKDQDARHEALVQLMRTYMIVDEMDNAKTVSDYLSKQKLNNKNQKDFFLVRSQYYLRKEDYVAMSKDLEEAIPLIKKKDEKSRALFILGQVYQLLDDKDKAYKNYRKVLKENPPYELSFYTRLYLAQVTPVDQGGKKKRIDKYFRKLLKDQKNIEYRDKIYYEMAMFEYKQNNRPKTIEYLEKSLQEGNNGPQKGHSYLKLAEIYYDDEQNFPMAKLYYDSTVTVFDKKDKKFPQVSERQKILEEFVTYYNIIQKEDSLQKLAKLDTAALNKQIDRVIAFEKAQSEKAKKIQEARAAQKDKNKNDQQNNNNSPLQDPFATSTYYFYSPAAVAAGKTEFLKRWGPRKLEDDWRRSTKEVKEGIEKNDVDTIKVKVDDKKEKNDTLNKETKIDRSLYLKDIPYSAEALKASNERIEDAMYHLGKIYDQKLKEEHNAIKTYSGFITRFAASRNVPEILYALYLIYLEKEPSTAEKYKNQLLNEHPKSLYANLLKNKNYLSDHKKANDEANALYREAFDLYKNGKYFAADSMVIRIRKQYPDNEISDKLQFLRVLVTGQTKNALVYQQQLEDFMTNFEASPLVPKAQEMLAASKSFMTDKQNKGLSVSSEDVKYIKELDKKAHYFIMMMPGQKDLTNDIRFLESFNKKSNLNLKVEKKMLGDSIQFVRVSGLEDKSAAMKYLVNLKNDGMYKSRYQNLNPELFVISFDNFELFNKSGNTGVYLKFFRENY